MVQRKNELSEQETREVDRLLREQREQMARRPRTTQETVAMADDIIAWCQTPVRLPDIYQRANGRYGLTPHLLRTLIRVLIAEGRLVSEDPVDLPDWLPISVPHKLPPRTAPLPLAEELPAVKAVRQPPPPPVPALVPAPATPTSALALVPSGDKPVPNPEHLKNVAVREASEREKLVLDVFSKQGPLRSAEVEAKTGLLHGTCHRILSVLASSQRIEVARQGREVIYGLPGSLGDQRVDHPSAARGPMTIAEPGCKKLADLLATVKELRTDELRQQLNTTAPSLHRRLKLLEDNALVTKRREGSAVFWKRTNKPYPAPVALAASDDAPSSQPVSGIVAVVAALPPIPPVAPAAPPALPAVRSPETTTSRPAVARQAAKAPAVASAPLLSPAVAPLTAPAPAAVALLPPPPPVAPVAPAPPVSVAGPADVSLSRSERAAKLRQEADLLERIDAIETELNPLRNRMISLEQELRVLEGTVTIK